MLNSIPPSYWTRSAYADGEDVTCPMPLCGAPFISQHFSNFLSPGLDVCLLRLVTRVLLGHRRLVESLFWLTKN